jgi:hypothetical protein
MWNVAQTSSPMVVERGVEAAVARSVEGGRDAVVDEDGAADLAGGGREKPLPRLGAHAVVGGAADGEVTLLEGVGEREDAAERLAVHVAL